MNNKNTYWKQRNICINILRKTEKQYYSSLDVSKVADNKKFWKTVKNSFFNKSNNFETINLVENKMENSEDQKIADIFIEYFYTTKGCDICYKCY